MDACASGGSSACSTGNRDPACRLHRPATPAWPRSASTTRRRRRLLRPLGGRLRLRRRHQLPDRRRCKAGWAASSLLLLGPPANDEFARAQPIVGGLPDSATSTRRATAKRPRDQARGAKPAAPRSGTRGRRPSGSPRHLHLHGWYCGSTPAARRLHGRRGRGPGRARRAMTRRRCWLCGKGPPRGRDSKRLAGHLTDRGRRQERSSGLTSTSKSTSRGHPPTTPSPTRGRSRLATASMPALKQPRQQGAGRARPRGEAGGASVWYTWTPRQRPGRRLHLYLRQQLDTLLAVYTGSAFGELAWCRSDDSGGSCNPDSQVSSRPGRHHLPDRRRRQDRRYGRFATHRGPAGQRRFRRCQELSRLHLIHPRAPIACDQRVRRARTRRRGGGRLGLVLVDAGREPKVGLAVCSYSALDTLLAVYTGSAPGELAPVTSNDDGEPGLRSRQPAQLRRGGRHPLRDRPRRSPGRRGRLGPPPGGRRARAGDPESDQERETAPAPSPPAPRGSAAAAPASAASIAGAEVTLTADAAPGSVFAGWSGAGCGGAGPCHLTLTGSRSVEARFEARPRSEAASAGAATATSSLAPSPCRRHFPARPAEAGSPARDRDPGRRGARPGRACPDGQGRQAIEANGLGRGKRRSCPSGPLPGRGRG